MRKKYVAMVLGAIALVLLPPLSRMLHEWEYQQLVDEEIALTDKMRDGRPWDGNTHEMMADFHKRYGRWDKAAECYTKATELEGCLFNPYLKRAECYEKLGRHDEATTDRLTAPNWDAVKGRLKTPDEWREERFDDLKAKGWTVYIGKDGKPFLASAPSTTEEKQK